MAKAQTTQESMVEILCSDQRPYCRAAAKSGRIPMTRRIALDTRLFQDALNPPSRFYHRSLYFLIFPKLNE